MKKKISDEKRRNYIVLLFTMGILVWLLNRAIYLPQGGYETRRILLRVITIVGLTVIPILMVKMDFTNKIISHCISWTKDKFNRFLIDWKKYLIYIAIYLIGAIFACGIMYVICAVKGYRMHLHWGYVGVAIYTLLYLCFLFRRDAYRKAEIFVFWAIIILGLFSNLVTPRFIGTVPDDETHYQRTLQLLYYTTGYTYEADSRIVADYADNVLEHLYYDEQSANKYYQELEKSYQRGQGTVLGQGCVHLSYPIAYVVPALGIMLGRALRLPYMYAFIMGKMAICVLYASLVYGALKIMKKNKLLLASVALLPSAVFLCSAYNYDYWILGWILFGYAHFFEILEGDSPIQTRDIVVSAGAIVIGIIPKIVYFPLLFPFLFLPRNRLNKRQKIVINATVFLVIIGVAYVLLLPIITNPNAFADNRGGNEVSTMGQIQYVLSAPLVYINLLYEFGKAYFSAGDLGVSYQNFYYIGQGEYWGLAFATVLVAAFVDKDENIKLSVGMRVAITMGTLGAFILVATSMYLAFTPVGSDSVAGVQSRYAYPLLVPFFYALTPNTVSLLGKRDKWMIACVLILGVSMVVNLAKLCVVLY